MNVNSKNIVITSATRTAIGKLGGSLKDLTSYQMGSIVIKEALKRSKVQAKEVDEVIMGQVLTAGTGQNPSRQAAIGAGVPVEKTAYVINQVCGSGLRSVISGYQNILLNDSKILVAGGQESMSNAPYTIDIRGKKELLSSNLEDSMIKDGLLDAFNNYHMGITAENVAEKLNITRLDQDNFSFLSQDKTQKAIKEGKFKKEIVKTDLIEDENPRENITIEKLSSLQSVFKENGTVTAGNSSGLNDGAAAVVLMDSLEAEKRGLDPLARIVSWATCGVDPSLMGLGPIPASKKALEKANWSVKDLDLIEANEAFASQSIAFIKDLKIPAEKVNVNGGAIALGHPIGASGTRILVTLLHEMIRRDVKKGLATLCIGGGMGIAMCLERNF